MTETEAAPITSIADLMPDPRNPRARGPRAEGMIVKSLQEVGAARSIVIDEDGRILAGNGTVEAAAEAGISRVQVVDVDGETIVAVRRRGLTEAQKIRLGILDNRTSELAGWDPGILSDFASEGIPVDDLFTEAEFNALIEGFAGYNGGYNPNTAPETSTGLVSQEDLAKAKKELEDKFRQRMAAKPILCPHCGEEFFLEERYLDNPANGTASDQ